MARSPDAPRGHTARGGRPVSAVIDALGQWPLLAVAVAVVMRAGLAWQSELTWPEYRAVHRAKVVTFPLLQRWQPLGYDSFINEKGGRDDAEYLTTVDATPRTVAGWFCEAGASLHLFNSVKHRPRRIGHGDAAMTLDRWGRYSYAHVVWVHVDGSQTEAYFFRNPDGTTDIYVHGETVFTDPEGHLTDPQTDGDVRGVVGEALDRNA